MKVTRRDKLTTLINIAMSPDEYERLRDAVIRMLDDDPDVYAIELADALPFLEYIILE